MNGAVSGSMSNGHDVLATMRAGVLVISHDGRVTYANPAVAEILQRPLELVVGRALAKSLLPLEQLLTHGNKGSSELTIARSDGGQVVLSYSVSAANASGERSVLIQPMQELSQLRKERDRLLQMAALGDALPSILHELRNPLAAVTSALEVLIEDCEPGLHTDLHAILWEVRRMNLSLQAVGGLVRPLHSKGHVAVDLAVGEVCRILGPNAAQRGIELRCEVPSLPLLPLDWGVVSGMVFNLVKNALDATSQGGHVLVRVSLERAELFTLEVSDDGAGMSPEVLSRCRELFYTSKQTGSGIGLTLCQRIAEQSGGELEILSSEGKGTHVRVSVPLHPPTSNDPVSARGGAHELTSPHE
ncbi:MAG TPA: ATP-binding protein [Polyangiales bacterium]